MRQDNVPNTDIYEIHVYKDSKAFQKAVKAGHELGGHEVGVLGPDGQWLNKHGHTEAPNLTQSTQNQLRGTVVDNARKRGWLPDKGQALLKGRNMVHRIQEGMRKSGVLRQLSKLGQPLGIVGGTVSLLSNEKKCEIAEAAGVEDAGC